MKKRLSFFIPILLILLIVSSCDFFGNNGNKADNKYVLEGLHQAEDYIEIDYDELVDMKDRKLSFMLYIGNPTCGGCNLFSPIYSQFAIDYGLKLYYITPSTELDSIVKIQYTPSLVPFQEGKPVVVVDPIDDEKPFENVENLKNFTTKYFTLPSMYEVSESSLDEMISNNDEFIIYFYWKYCSDCAKLAANILNDYQINNQGLKNFYFIEINEWRNTPEKQNAEEWITFASKYELNTYRHGVTPTLQYRKGSEIVEMAVYLNDTFEVIDSSTNTIKVTQSFYEDAPYLNQTLTREEFNTQSLQFHKDKILDFLNSNLPRVQN